MQQNPFHPDSPDSAKPKESRLYLDKEGRWFHEGIEVTHSRTCLLFSQNLRKGPDNEYYIHVGRENAMVEVEDTPYMVRSVSVHKNDSDVPFDFTLFLNDKSQEPLDPYTLVTGQDNVMYCRVKNRTERARFLRPAYYQICEHIVSNEKGNRYWLPWNGEMVPILLNTKNL